MVCLVDEQVSSLSLCIYCTCLEFNSYCRLNSFIWYKNDKEEETEFVFALDGLKMRDIEKSFAGRKHGFSLVNVSGKNIYRDLKQVKTKDMQNL